MDAFPRPLIIAHRGYRDAYPENTIVAFEAALEAGADMLELDVMLTRDRQAVVIHDLTLERTTNGRGPVEEFTLAELDRLDVGSWFHPRFAGERIPTLAQVLDRFGGRTRIDIEIKAAAFESHRPADAIERQVVRMVQEKGLEASVLVSSFEWRALESIARMGEGPALALISWLGDERPHLETGRRLNAFSWHPNCRELAPEQVREARSAGLRVFPYHVDTPELLERMMQMGTDGVITNDPLMARDWLLRSPWAGGLRAGAQGG